MKRKKNIERAKTALLILLTVNSVFFAYKTEIFNSYFSELGIVKGLLKQESEGAEAQPEGLYQYQTAALPQAVAITGPSGLRFGLKYDSEGIKEIFNKFSSELGEALGSAAQPVSVTEEEWSKALSAQSVYYDFGIDLSLEVLANWLGTDMKNWSEGSACRLFLTDDGNGETLLYYMDAAGSFWRCETKAVWATIASELETYLPNGAEFCYEKRDLKDALKDAEPYSLIINELPELHTLLAQSSPFGDELKKRASEVLKVSLYGSYLETDGTLVYVDSSGTVKLSPDGYIRYTASEGGEGLTAAKSEAEMIEKARSIIVKLRSVFAGEEELSLTSVTHEDTNYRIYFKYVINGCDIKLNAEAASAMFKDGRLVQLKVKARSYTLTEDRVEVLPELAAAAAAGSLIKGSEAKLVWADTGGDKIVIRPDWIAEVA